MQQKQFSIFKLGLIIILIASINAACKKNNNTIQQPTPPAGFVLIPSSTATDSIGCDYSAFINERPRHKVIISSFFMAKTELTRDSFAPFLQSADTVFLPTDHRKLSDYNGGSAVEQPQQPIVNVRWYDAIVYCNWRSKREGLKPTYIISLNLDGTIKDVISCDFSANGYRLPTEAEWEYACSAGSSKAYYFGDDQTKLGEYAWYNLNAGDSSHIVGQKKPNVWGLYDMHGNVFEWVWDWLANYTAGTQIHPTGPDTGTTGIERGGYFGNLAFYLRSAFRNPDSRTTESRGRGVGFRLARNI